MNELTDAQKLILTWWNEKHKGEELPKKLSSELATEHYKWLVEELNTK